VGIFGLEASFEIRLSKIETKFTQQVQKISAEGIFRLVFIEPKGIP